MISIRRASSLALLLTALGAAPALAQGAPKFAYINSQVVLDKAPGRAAAEAAFNKEMSGFRDQLQKMSASVDTLIAQYQRGEATMTAAVKETKQREIRAKQEELQNRSRQLEQQAQQRQFELAQPMMDQIRTVLDEIRAAEGFAFIFDVGSQGATIVAADKNLDITERVVARLKPIPATASNAARPDSTKATPGPRSTPAGVTRPKPPTQ